MTNWPRWQVSLTCLMLGWCISGFAQTISVSGKVWVEPANGQEAVTPLAGVGLSNGLEVVKTDADGQYAMDIAEGQYLFVITPSHFNVRTNEFHLPQFYFSYEELLKNRKANFMLEPTDTTVAFKVAMLGDLQMRNEEEVNYTNRLLTPELYLRKDIDLAIMLGDIADDSLGILRQTRQITKHFPMMTYGVFGNHDRDLADNFTQSYQEVFGPDYYAFNKGKVHFIVMNDVVPNAEGGYRGGISQEQLSFIANDLKYVPQDYLIVFCQHIPIYTLHNRQALFELLEGRKHLLAVSGHRHVLEQEFIQTTADQKIHEVVAGAVCGLWWDGERDWKGIPTATMGFGAPKGYYVFSFESNEYQMNYKAFELPAKKQMNIWTWYPDRGDVGSSLPHGFEGNEIVANVFAGSERTEVLFRVDDNEWQPMKKVNIPDPFVSRIIALEQLGIYPTQGQIPSGLKVEDSKHIWLGYYDPNLSQGSHRVEVKARDAYGLDAFEVSFFMVR